MILGNIDIFVNNKSNILASQLSTNDLVSAIHCHGHNLDLPSPISTLPHNGNFMHPSLLLLLTPSGTLLLRSPPVH